jgi:hypothetical protein
MNKPHDEAHHNGLLRFFFLIPCLLGFALLTAFPSVVFPQELEMINRPVNTSGLTGLLFTTTPFTLPSRSVELGVAVLSESSTIPKYTITELPVVTITTGIAYNMELGLKGSYFQITEVGGNKARGAGDAELSYKWNFSPQKEDSPLPAVALILTGIAPTGNKDISLNEVHHWGARFGLAAGSEITWGAHALGIYADAKMVVHDLSDEQVRDRYGIINAGLLFPISKYRNLQMLLEYTVVSGKDRMTLEGGNYSAITSGLRLVSERFNLSIGTQFLRKQLTGYENSSRVVGMTSIKF